MNLTLVGLLVFLVLAALWRPAEMQNTKETWVSNGSSQTVGASLGFNYPLNQLAYWIVSDLVILPGDHQGGNFTYPYAEWGVTVEIWVAGGCCHAQLTIPSDRSVVLLDYDGLGGLSLYLVIYGKLFQPEGNLLMVLFPQMFLHPDGTLGNCVNVC